MTQDNERDYDIFKAAKELPSADREPFLDRECGDDDDLRAEVESLLEQHFTSAQTVQPNEQSSDTTLDYQRGDMIGSFKILNVLGEGGMGIVYLAEQSKPVKRRVALKVIKAGMDTKQVVARFEAERQALAIMNHPGIAQVYEAGVTEHGRPYFVMEHVKGMPITDACDELKLTTKQRLEIMAKVCDAVQHAHSKMIIHRDLKPSNILADANGEIKIIDFGVAKAMTYQLTEKTLVTQVGHFVGTPAYMSPEQADLKAIDIDAKTDVYALGVVLYEVLTGMPPFDSQALLDAGLEKMREIIRTQPPPKPSTQLSSIDDVRDATKIAQARQTQIEALAGLLRKELEWIPLKALKKQRSERYDSAKSMGDDIRRYLAGEALEAGPDSSLYTFKKTLRKHKGPFIAAAIVFLVLVGGIITTKTQAIRANKQATIATDEKINAEQARAEAVQAREQADAAKLVAEGAKAEALISLHDAEAANQESVEHLRAANAAQKKSRELTIARDISVGFASDMISGEQLKEAALESGIDDYKEFLNLWLTKTVAVARNRYEDGDDQSQQALATVLLQAGFSYLRSEDFRSACDHILEGVEMYHQLHGTDHQAWMNTRNIAPALMLLHDTESLEFINSELSDQQRVIVEKLWNDALPHWPKLNVRDQSTILQALKSGLEDQPTLKTVYQISTFQRAMDQPISVSSIPGAIQKQLLSRFKEGEISSVILEQLVKYADLLGLAKPRACVDELVAIITEAYLLLFEKEGEQDAVVRSPIFTQLIDRTATWSSDYGLQDIVDSLGSSTLSDTFRDLIHNPMEGVHPEDKRMVIILSWSRLLTAWNESWEDRDFRHSLIKKLEPFRQIGIIFEIVESEDSPSISLDVDTPVFLINLLPSFVEPFQKTAESLGFSNPRKCAHEFLSIATEMLLLYYAYDQDTSKVTRDPKFAFLITRFSVWSSDYGVLEVLDSLGSQTLSDVARQFTNIFQDQHLVKLSSDFQRDPDLHTQEEWITLLVEAVAKFEQEGPNLVADMNTAWNESWADQDFREALAKKLTGLQDIGLDFQIDESSATPSASWEIDYSVLLQSLDK